MSATTTAVAIIAPFVGVLAARIERRVAISLAAVAVALPVVSAHAGSFRAVRRALCSRSRHALHFRAVDRLYRRALRSRHLHRDQRAVRRRHDAGELRRPLRDQPDDVDLGWRHASTSSRRCVSSRASRSTRACRRPAIARRVEHVADSRAGRPQHRHARPAACIVRDRRMRARVAGRNLHVRRPALTRAPFNFGTVGIGAIYAVFLVAVVVRRWQTPRAASRPARAGACRGRARDRRALLTLSDHVPVIPRPRAQLDRRVRRTGVGQYVHLRRRRARARRRSASTCPAITSAAASVPILPVPGWHRWGWAGCVAFVVAAQAIVGVLVYRFWHADGTAGPAQADARGVTPSR